MYMGPPRAIRYLASDHIGPSRTSADFLDVATASDWRTAQRAFPM